jgi:flavin-dependent dehydrogenase
MNSTADVLVIGGGPAGLAAAIAACQRGFRVTLADSEAPPIDKTCGEGLLPHSIPALDRLGVVIPASESFAFRGIRFIGAGRVVDADFPVGRGVAVRRTVLHRLMVERAERAGVHFLWKTRFTALDAEGAWFGGKLVRAHYVVGADGGNSSLRRAARLDGRLFRTRRFAFRRHFRTTPWSEYMELYWGPGRQIYLSPVGAEEVCVVAISRDPQIRLPEALQMFPELAARLRGAPAASAERGAVTSSLALRRVHRGRLALLGDASGMVDAITGEGMCLSFLQAVALAAALEAGDLSLYQREHRRLAVRPLLMATLLLSLDRHAWLRHRVLGAFGAHQHLFERFLAMHVGSISAPAFLRSGVLPLTLRLLRDPAP